MASETEEISFLSPSSAIEIGGYHVGKYRSIFIFL